ncbi:MAG: hypothetical protein RL641_250 [Candidatus Parcubacteria bacterium]
MTAIDESKKAVIYCRVSTKEQVEEGNSLVTQERLCREYAALYGFIVDQVFIELGESAKTAERTQLKKMLAYCSAKKNNIAAVIVYKIDRLSRNMTDYTQIRFNLRRYNVEIRSKSEQFEDNPSGRFMENMFANVAQFDNEVRGERALNGLKEAVREGRYVWSAPIGYSNEKIDGKSTIVPSEYAPQIRKAFELLAENKYTIEEVRQQILQIGFVGKKFKLAKAHFNRLIRNALYAGKIVKFGTVTQGTFQPILTEELFNAVQQIINKQKTKRTYTRIHPEFPLRQLCYTEYGSRLSGGFSTGKMGQRYPYYFFKREFINLKRDSIDDSFINLLNDYCFTTEKMKKFRTIVRVKLNLFLKKASHEVEQLKEQMDKIAHAESTIVFKLSEGKISDSLFDEQMENFAKQKSELKRKIDLTPTAEANFDKIYFALNDFLVAPGTFWQKADIATKIKIQEFNFPRGVIYKDNKIRTQEPPIFYNALLSESITQSLNAEAERFELSIPFRACHLSKVVE